MMIFFHFHYDLALFNLLPINLQHFFWWIQPRIIVMLFFTCVGLSLAISHQAGQLNLQKIGRRFLKLFSLALLISATTYLLYPDHWIYFGTLHSIAFGSLVGFLFLNHPKSALMVALTFFGLKLGTMMFPQHPWWTKIELYGEYPLQQGFPQFPWPKSSLDYIPLYPWSGFILLGVWLHHQNFHLWPLPTPLTKFTPYWHFLSRHSLKIYLLHQPLLFAFTSFLSLLFLSR